MGLTSQQRLRGTSGVSDVIKGARPTHYEGLSIRVLKNRPGEQTRFSVVVPGSVHASAVKRNSLRRRITEALRTVLQQHAPNTGMSVVLMARRENVTPEEIRESVMSLLKKSGILQQ